MCPKDTDIENLELGKTIAQFRLMKQYTLTELAERIQISPSMLSQIERGISNPSLTTLRKLAEVLDVPLFRFFTPAENTENLIVRPVMRKKIVLPESPHLVYQVLSPTLRDSIGMLLLTLQAGECTGEQYAKHTGGVELAYILSGDVSLFMDKTVYILHEGDSVKIPSGMIHKWENQSEGVVQVIFAITPPQL
ncbi:helix-turn-helix domain-containing protein [Megasphaera stantonii]|jgi:transcriptional regulator with XRE-family HTH domain|uniref:helix-turn-helix domain-containing protein n=1 Tax=Megasphaera stantonii TaxID=2144175 RepID=UPI0019578DD7|nr:helix-turn-helix domain-containing protein [Megasphaera stantonii]